MGQRIIQLKGRLVAFDGNKPLQVLSPDEVKEVRRKSSPQYKASQLSNKDLLEQFVDMLLKEIYLEDKSEHHEKVMVYMAEILWRMNKHQ